MKQRPTIKNNPSCTASPKSQYNKRYGERNNLDGKCYFCTNSKLEHTKFCEKCFFRLTARNILGDRTKGAFLKSLLEAQNYRCYLTGRPLVIGINASVDHIKPKKLYPELARDTNNVAWCHYDVNMAKRAMTNEQLISMAIAIVRHNRD